MIDHIQVQRNSINIKNKDKIIKQINLIRRQQVFITNLKKILIKIGDTEVCIYLKKKKLRLILVN